MFNKKRIKALERQITSLEVTLERGLYAHKRYMERELKNQAGNHLLYGIPVWDEDGPTQDREEKVDVRDVVRELADFLGMDIRVQKGVPSHVVLHTDD